MLFLKLKSGFTLVELMISVAIFVFMTALLVAKFGNFNSGPLLTDAAYDVALAIRTAQSYGLSVKQDNSNSFSSSYGIYFNIGSTHPDACIPADNTHFVLFSSPADVDLVYCDGSNPSTSIASSYFLKNGVTISDICFGTPSSCGTDVDNIAISYTRPDPVAVFGVYICSNGRNCSGGGNGTPGTLDTSAAKFVRITLRGSDGTTRTIGIYKNGQVAVGD